MELKTFHSQNPPGPDDCSWRFLYYFLGTVNFYFIQDFWESIKRMKAHFVKTPTKILVWDLNSVLRKVRNEELEVPWEPLRLSGSFSIAVAQGEAPRFTSVDAGTAPREAQPLPRGSLLLSQDTTTRDTYSDHRSTYL